MTDPTPRPDDADLEAIRASDPDVIGLMDVMELIAPNARVTGWHRMTGGSRGAMHRIDVTMPSGAETAFVLHRYLPETGDDAAVATREAATLEALRDTPVAAPEVLWLDADGTVFGRPAMATTFLSGRVRAADVADDPAVLTGLADALVSTGWVPIDDLGNLPRHDDPTEVVGGLLRSVPRSDLVDAPAMADALVAHAGSVSWGPVALVHGDFHVANVLFDGARATGIVDWRHAHLGDPRSDVAYCAFELDLLAGREVADAFLAAHASLRGDLTDAPWWRLLAAAYALPDPRARVSSWHDVGAEVTTDQVAERYVAWVTDALTDLTS